MYSVEDLILKILKHKSSGKIDEIKVDLQRVCTYGFGSCQEDIGYIEFLYKHYSQEISKINNMTLQIRNNEINNRSISNVENIRNYLIKIAIIRICNQKAIQYQIEDMNNPNYCINLINES